MVRGGMGRAVRRAVLDQCSTVWQL